MGEAALPGALLSQGEVAEKNPNFFPLYLHDFLVKVCFIFPSIGVSHRVAGREYLKFSHVIRNLEELGWVMGTGRRRLLSNEE